MGRRFKIKRDRLILVVLLIFIVLTISACDMLLGNRAPVAVIAASTTSGKPPLTVKFNGLSSYDPDGNITAYRWDFGDSNTASGAIITHTYISPGIFTVTLTVTDNGGKRAKALVYIKILTFSLSKISRRLNSKPVAIISQDFDGDNNIDLAVANQFSDDVSILLGNGDGSFQPAQNQRVGDAPSAIIAADFDRDNILDLAVTNLNDSNIAILLGNGDGSFKAPVKVAIRQDNAIIGNGPIGIVTADFDRDGRLDLATVNEVSDNIAILLGRGDGTFKARIAFREGAGENLKAITTADFDRDGYPDLATANQDSHNISLYFGRGGGIFEKAINFPASYGPKALTSADFNDDGNPDLATANFAAGSVSILLGGGTGAYTFGTAINLNVGDGPVALISTDIDGDEVLDLVVANQESDNISILLGAGEGSFEQAINFDVGAGPSSLTSADFNKDGRMDLAVTDVNGDDISVLLNTTP